MSGARILPSSLAQQRLWVLNRLEPRDAADVVVSVWETDAPLDVDGLAAAARDLARDHEVLRTVLRSVDGHVRQLVLDPAPDVVIISRPARSVDDAVAVELDDGFDVESGPLWRISLARLDGDRLLFVVAMHAAIADQRSADLVARQLIEPRSLSGVETSTSQSISPAEFLDLVRRQGDADEAAVELLEHWRSLVTSRPPVIDLPSDLPRPKLPVHRTRRIPLAVDEARLAQLDALATSCDTTVDVVLLTACALTIRAFSQRDEFVLGVWHDHRRDGAGRALGPFTDIRPVAVDLSDVPCVRDHVTQLRDQTRDQMTVPFGRLVEELGVARDPGRHPLVQVAFSYLDRTAAQRCAPVSTKVGASRLDLEFLVERCADGPRALLSYATDVFDAGTMTAMARTFDLLTAALAGSAESELSYVDDEHSAAGAAATPSAAAGHTTVVHLVDEQARNAPDTVAFVHGTVTWTYRQLVERSEALADALIDAGVGDGDMVVVHGHRRPDLIAGYLAVLRIGAAYVPIGPDMPSARLAGILADAGPKVVLTDQPDVPDGAWRCLPLDAEAATPAPGNRSRPGEVAYVCYTSGSTGKPKGVAIEHAALSHFVAWYLDEYRLGPSDVVSWATGIGFDASVGDIWPSLVAGATIVLPEDELLRLQPEAFARWLDDAGVTVCFLPSPLAEAFLDNTDPEQVPRLRFLLTGGDRFNRRPSPAASYRVVNQYGPTESTVWSTFSVVSASGDGAPTIGTPIPNVTAYVLDGRRRVLPRGAFGELYLGGPQVARGYLNRPELSAERFVPDPFAAQPDARMYRTGDIVRWTAAGELQFLGRSDGQVKIRGVRIEPAEIEAVLLSHPAVREAAVVARPGRTGQLELVAHLVPGVHGVATADLAALVKQCLPQAFWPSAYLLTDRFPLSANGKLDRTALAARPLPDEALPGSTRPPEGPVEELVARVWTKVLNRDRIGAEDNFFALGGDSLLAIQVVSQLAADGMRVRLIDVFDQPTVAELAAVVGRDEAVAVTPVMRATGAALAVGAPVGGRVHVVQVPDGIDTNEIVNEARRVASRHDGLRLRFDPDGPSATLCGDGVVHVEACDDETTTVDEHAARLGAMTTRFDGPVLAIVHMRAASQLVIAAHPLCVDPESWPVLLAELAGGTPGAGTGKPWLAAANEAYRTTTVELLVAAAVLAVGERHGWSDITVEVDSDGRTDGVPAVGLHTARRRVALSVASDVAGVITEAKNALRSPESGERAAGAHTLRLTYHDPQWADLPAGWRRIREIRLPTAQAHDLEVEVTPGEPSPGVVASDRFEDAFRTALTAVLDHCSSVRPGQFTASDFPLFSLVKPKVAEPRRSR
ncbi:non-ribosomal peptide synthetase [Kutzneria kofuensis]|uniref:Amino acid adenylation domain-containing protein n=1 Tax=Kutzneria kofuensis TaxID=103725 RepID=A0A7W9KPP4_9PSEU|nr:non-ribosomal peptide synthetase [Kutzneria kofuensis]MBB5896367.1 amino acid adenylation domain-containing protein [Kutzneria kofuensis]